MSKTSSLRHNTRGVNIFSVKILQILHSTIDLCAFWIKLIKFLSNYFSGSEKLEFLYTVNVNEKF